MTSSENLSRVPIKNIYYMLVYAWNHPHEKNLISAIDEDEKDLLNLLSKILLIKVKALIKKGYYKEYIETHEESVIIRGKILFKESLQSFSYKRGKMHNLHEDMSYNILHNQIIKTTMYYLSRSELLDKEYQDEIRKILPYFNGISIIKFTGRVFREITLHRNNQHYQFLLDICQFIWENALLHEGESEKLFQDFSREHQQMARLFENFVKNFYRRELKGATAKGESFYWPAEGEKIEYLPKMTTDISLEYHNGKIIMDTKFYKDMFGQNWNKESVRSGHLYQLFAYLKNDEYYNSKKAKGILLYPRVNNSMNLNYIIHGYSIKICTIDLNENWKRVHERLLEIVH